MATITTAAATARREAEAAWNADPSDANLAALKAASEAEDIEYLAGFDERHAEDAALAARISNKAKADAWEARKAEMREEGAKKAAERLASTTPLRRAYDRYIHDGLSDTDGHFAPLSFEEWKMANTTYLPPTPEYRTLAPKAKVRGWTPGEPRRNRKRPHSRG